MPPLPTDAELERCNKRYRRWLHRSPGKLVHVLKDALNGCKYFFFGNVNRTIVSFFFLMSCWGFTVYCIAQFLADQYEADECSKSILESRGQSTCRNPTAALRHSRVWPHYALLFYTNILLVSPLIAMLYNSGRRPLFLAVRARESQAHEGVGSTELIELAQAVVAREIAKPLVGRNGCGHLTTAERGAVGLSRRKAERLVQFVCMATSAAGGRSRVLDEAELAAVLSRSETHCRRVHAV